MSGPYTAAKRPPCADSLLLIMLLFSRQAQQHQHQKMQPKPSASQRVKGEPSTSVLMMAAVTGSAKL